MHKWSNYKMASSQEYFKNLAKNREEERKQEEANRGQSFSYDDVFWTGFSQSGEGKILRSYSPFYLKHESEYDLVTDTGEVVFPDESARVVNYVFTINDDKKRSHFYVPDEDEDPDYIYHRLMKVVLEKEYVDDPEGKKNPDGSIKKVPNYIHQQAYPLLIDRFLTNGAGQGINPSPFPQGWRRQRKFMGNFIDRGAYDRHRETQAWFLLSKNVYIPEGKDFGIYDKGVSAGITQRFNKLVQSYGGLNTFDIYVERTGEKNNPWTVIHAHRTIEEVPERYQDLVVASDDFTDEELSWTPNNIRKLFKPSSYSKWYRNHKVLLKEVDGVFHTHFLEEVKEKAEEEKAQFQQENEEQAEKSGEATKTQIDTQDNPIETPVKQEESTEVPKRQKRERTSSGIRPVTWEDLEAHGYKGEQWFTEELANAIEKVNNDGSISWKEGTSNPMECFDPCTFEQPDGLSDGCIYCGEAF